MIFWWRTSFGDEEVERLRKAVMSASFSSDTSQLKVTLSIGIATTPSDAKTKEEVAQEGVNRV